MSTLDKLTNVVVERLGVDPKSVTLDANFKDDLGADSLDVVELIMSMEDEFGLEIPDEDAERLATVGDVVKYIEYHQ